MSRPLLTVPDVAVILAASERFVLDELRRKNLRGTKLAAGWRIAEADLVVYPQDPREDLAVLAAPSLVVLRGRPVA